MSTAPADGRAVRTQPSAIGGPPRLGHRPALDGVRALAVGLVLLHHLMIPGLRWSWIDQGKPYIGVDVFFALSGFLITRLMLDEVGRTGRVALGSFWARRALRLLPLAVAVVAVVMALHAIDHDLFLREGPYVPPWRDALAALGYHMNILQMIRGDHHDWALTHTWSLSIEEQFYVVWPLAVALVARRRAASAPLVVFVGSTVIVVASGAWRSVLQERGSLDHVYNSLDSRAGQLCAGAALAGASILWPSAVARLGHLGWAGLIGLVLIGVRGTHGIPTSLDYDVVALLSLVLIASACELGDTHGVGRTMRWSPLQWIGRRSYALYLVHYPVMLALTPDATGLSTIPLVVLRLSVSFAIAALAHRVIERPTLALRSRSRLFASA